MQARMPKPKGCQALGWKVDQYSALYCVLPIEPVDGGPLTGSASNFPSSMRSGRKCSAYTYRTRGGPSAKGRNVIPSDDDSRPRPRPSGLGACCRC